MAETNEHKETKKRSRTLKQYRLEQQLKGGKVMPVTGVDKPELLFSSVDDARLCKAALLLGMKRESQPEKWYVTKVITKLAPGQSESLQQSI